MEQNKKTDKKKKSKKGVKWIVISILLVVCLGAGLFFANSL